jgi:AmmeMemoRadiSam system protein B/AmmeMemoRadiSam system protein A
MEGNEMKPWHFLIFVLAVAITALATCYLNAAAKKDAGATGKEQPPPKVPKRVRKAAKAGGFYTADPAKLKKQIADFLGRVKAQPLAKDRSIFAIISPHAGYVYSGHVAAWAYKQVAGRSFETVVLIGPPHSTFSGASVWPEGVYETPLGRIWVDEALAKKITESSDAFTFNEKLHLKEHSLEVQLPFLQQVLKGPFKIVPILITIRTTKDFKIIASGIADAIKGKNVLIVCSTDLSHYPAYDVAKAVDAATIEVVKKMDPAKVLEHENAVKESGRAECALCGHDAVAVTLELAKMLGADKVELLKAANSFDSPDVIEKYKDKSHVVGYAALRITAEKKGKEMGISEQGQKKLLSIARAAIAAKLANKNLPTLGDLDDELAVKSGVFVTLRKKDKDKSLRGCRGCFSSDDPLAKTVQEIAISSAFYDDRFPSIKTGDLDNIKIGISVLSPMKKISDPYTEIELGKHGIWIKKGMRSGTYLPEVATEHEMSLEEFLSSCSRTRPSVSRNDGLGLRRKSEE